MDMEEQNKRQNKMVFKAIVTLVIIAIIVIGIIYIIQNNDAEAQLKDFKNSVQDKDASSVAQYLSNSKRKMTKTEASHLIEYLNKKNNKKQLDNTIDKAVSNIKSRNSAPELAKLKDKNDDVVLDISKNGKQMMFLDKISIEPHYREVYVKELDNNATYILSKNNKVPVDKKKLNKLGSFIVGDYNVSLKKQFDYTSVKGIVDGKIHIDTDRKKNGKIIAKQDFPQTKIKIKLHNNQKLSSKNKKLLINGKIKSLKEGKEYGYFPNENTFAVKAEGELNGDTFKTNSVDIYKGLTNNNTQVVNLYFDENEINKSIKEDKKKKKETKELITDYIDSLNKAYKNKSYKYVSEYIKEGSEAEKELKPRFKHKQDVHFKSVKVKSVEKQGSKYTVDVSKQQKGTTNITEYVVDGETNQIESYKNI